MTLYFFLNVTPTTEIYTLSLHDALPIWPADRSIRHRVARCAARSSFSSEARRGASLGLVLPIGLRYTDLFVVEDRKSTRLNSSHSQISYAVFCLKKKKNNISYCIKLVYI